MSDNQRKKIIPAGLSAAGEVPAGLQHGGNPKFKPMKTILALSLIALFAGCTAPGPKTIPFPTLQKAQKSQKPALVPVRSLDGKTISKVPVPKIAKSTKASSVATTGRGVVRVMSFTPSSVGTPILSNPFVETSLTPPFQTVYVSAVQGTNTELVVEYRFIGETYWNHAGSFGCSPHEQSWTVGMNGDIGNLIVRGRHVQCTPPADPQSLSVAAGSEVGVWVDRRDSPVVEVNSPKGKLRIIEVLSHKPRSGRIKKITIYRNLP